MVVLNMQNLFPLRFRKSTYFKTLYKLTLYHTFCPSWKQNVGDMTFTTLVEGFSLCYLNFCCLYTNADRNIRSNITKIQNFYKIRIQGPVLEFTIYQSHVNYSKKKSYFHVLDVLHIFRRTDYDFMCWIFHILIGPICNTQRTKYFSNYKCCSNYLGDKF